MYTDLDTVVPLVVVVLSPQVQFLVELSSWMSGIVDGKYSIRHVYS